ncbi:MAG: hypothetical protein HRU30_09850, partial [Rhodobacteraceae bacterium]|nr:hypothetical protein [Paracoccaceae bacterium]
MTLTNTPYLAMALNNAWANATFYSALSQLDPAAFIAKRPGFFASLAPASKIFYTATLILAAGHIWFPRTLSYQMLYWSGMLLGSYIVYASFTRTGWLIYAAGIVLIVLFQRGATRKSLALAMLGIAAVTLISYLAQNQAFLLRMAGGAAGYREDVEVGLDAILRSVGERLEERRTRVPLGDLHAQARDHEAGSTGRFVDAVGLPGLSIIAECKRRSPSMGELAPDGDMLARASGYADAGAAAVSVLTEQDHFGGSLADFDRVAQAGLPRLRKDFIIDEYMLLESAAHGAEAVLLIATCLDDNLLRDLR